MGFNLFSENEKIKYGIKNYIADYKKDLKNIPKNPGNMVYVIEEDNSIKTSLITEELKIRPAAYLDGKLNVSGKGTLDDPLKLSRGDTNEN